MDAWGKASREDPSERHHLVHHCADVASVFLTLCSLPAYRHALDHAAGLKLSDVALQRLGAIVFLHDIGKLNTGFQSRIWPEDQPRPRPAGHTREGMALLDPLFPYPALQHALQLPSVFGWAAEETVRAFLRASISHHGTPAEEADGTARAKERWSTYGTYNPAAAAQQMGEMLRHWFLQAFQEEKALPETQRFIHFFAGLVSLADWIGSHRDFFPYESTFDPDYFQRSQAQAAEVLRAFQLDTREQREAPNETITFQDLTGYANWNEHQEAINEVSPDEQLLILEAETGSGKTEAALLRFLRLWEAGKVDALYFAVPTRAAALQLHGRIHKAAKRMFGALAPETVLAVPGYLVAGETRGQKLPGYEVLWDDSRTAHPAILARRWAAENSKRYLAAQIAVGTVDQAMLAGLPVKHAHLRAASLARSLLVIDEVHASDRYMAEVQNGLLDMHLGQGGHALLMSATLGERARAKWLGTPPRSLSEAIDLPYPAIWSSSGIPITTMAASETAEAKSVTMELERSGNLESVLDHACELAGRGAKVLILRNTVNLAVETLQALEVRQHARPFLLSLAGQAAPHHSRYAPDDRRLLDAAVETHLGKKRGEDGCIVVGTQTLEQSLDIDADFLVTDLCPADVLLQRLGRLHRHKRRERPLSQPSCVLLTPDEGLESCLDGKTPRMINGLGGFLRNGALSGIYLDLLTVEATRQLALDHPVWEIPAMNRFLVESATHLEAHEKLKATLPQSWTQYDHDVLAGDIAKAQQANLIRLDPQCDYLDLRFPDGEERIRTRLGGEGLTISFPERPQGPFEQDVQQLTLPEHWSNGLDPMSMPEIIEENEIGFTFSLGAKSFSYGRFGIKLNKIN